MDVIFTCHDASYGGAARSLLTQAIDARAGGHAVTVYVPFGAWLIDELLAADVTVVQAPFPWVLADPADVEHDGERRHDATRSVVDAIAYWRSWCSRVQPAHGSVVVNIGLVHPFGAIAADVWGLPCLWHPTEYGWHDFGLEPLWGERQDYLDLVTQSATAVLVYSSHMAGELAPEHPDVRVIRTPFELPAPAPVNDSGALCVAVVGAVTAAKGQLALVEAAALVGAALPVRYLLRGSGHPTYLTAVRARIAATPGLAEQFTIESAVDGVDAAWRGVDIAVITSRREAFGRVGAEAMARGIPLLHADTPASAEIYGPREVSGALAFAADDPTALADAITEVVTSPALRARMRSHHRAWAADSFSPATAQELLLRLLADVAAAGRAPGADAALKNWLALAGLAADQAGARPPA